MKANEVRTGTIEMKVWFDGVEKPEAVKKLMGNGRFTGFLAECYVADVVGDAYVHTDAKGYDLLSTTGGKNIEVKSFTQHGAKLGPSTFYGAGRRADPALFEALAHEKNFVVVDQTMLATTGEVQIVFKRGEDVARIGHSVTKSNRSKLFGEVR